MNEAIHAKVLDFIRKYDLSGGNEAHDFALSIDICSGHTSLRELLVGHISACEKAGKPWDCKQRTAAPAPAATPPASPANELPLDEPGRPKAATPRTATPRTASAAPAASAPAPAAARPTASRPTATRPGATFPGARPSPLAAMPAPSANSTPGNITPVPLNLEPSGNVFPDYYPEGLVNLFSGANFDNDKAVRVETYLRAKGHIGPDGDMFCIDATSTLITSYDPATFDAFLMEIAEGTRDAKTGKRPAKAA